MTTENRTNSALPEAGSTIAEVIATTSAEGPTMGTATPRPTHGARRPEPGTAWLSTTLRGTTRALGAALLAVAPLLAACGDDSEPTTTAVTTPSWTRADASLAEQVQHLVDRLAPQTDGGSQEHDSWVDRVRATHESMDHADPDLGRAVLVLLDERDELDAGLRSRLLEAAARAMSKDDAARAELADFLTTRVETYGRAMGERNAACELLGTYCPERAVAVLGPLLLPDRRTSTLPDREFMLRGYLEGAKRTGLDASDLLSEIALDRRVDHFTRKIAMRELAKEPTPRAINVFDTVMTESSGDTLLRSAAVACYMQSVPTERAIDRLTEILEREAELHMQTMLENSLATLRGER